MSKASGLVAKARDYINANGLTDSGGVREWAAIMDGLAAELESRLPEAEQYPYPIPTTPGYYVSRSREVVVQLLDYPREWVNSNGNQYLSVHELGRLGQLTILSPTTCAGCGNAHKGARK